MAGQPNRRDVLALGAAAVTLGLTGDHRAFADVRGGGPIPKRPFGKTGAMVSILGLGGFHLGRTANAAQATSIVHEAIDAGVTFFDRA
jgi:hypothetical protein